MYKIKVKNLETGKMWWEYGFKGYLFKRIHFFYHETDVKGFEIYQVLAVEKIVFTWLTFKKCLTNCATMIEGR